MKAKRTILCVDDNQVALSLRKLMLETRGHRVITAENSDQAMQAFERGELIDLVLTDLIMCTGVDGAELARRVKRLSPSTPVILYSGSVRQYERDTCADVFLAKGQSSPADLLERIRIMLIHKRGPKPAKSAHLCSVNQAMA